MTKVTALRTELYFFLFRSFKESKYTKVVAVRSLQQLEEQHERKCVKKILMA
jgi:hypothetical protein